MWSMDFISVWKELSKSETGKSKIIFILGTPIIFAVLIVNDVLEWIKNKR